MIVEGYGKINRMKDNTDAGYGPGYVSDDTGSGWLFWVADCMGPPVYFLRCNSAEEAIEHAEVCLCSPLEEGELTDDEQRKIWEEGGEFGYSVGPDGIIRYTELLEMAELRPKNPRKYMRGL